MDLVKTPKERKLVVQPVPVIKGEIKQQEADRISEPSWPRDPVSDSNAMLMRPSAGNKADWYDQQAHRNGGGHCDGKVH
jgi:hypothetical protein